MRFRALPRGLVWAAVAGLVIVVVAFAWLKFAPRHVPEGQRRLVLLDEGSLQDLRDAFNATAGEVRVLALLSPT